MPFSPSKQENGYWYSNEIAFAFSIVTAQIQISLSNENEGRLWDRKGK